MPTQLAPNVFNLPNPPVNAVFNLAVANNVTYLIAAGLAVFLVAALLRSSNKIMVIAMILGSAVVTFNEPVFDIMDAVWHPIIGQNTAFTLLGRSVPLWAFPGYVGVYGCSALLMLQAFNSGITKRAVWLWCLVPIAADAVMEMVILHWNLYFYYANQPLKVLNFPLYQAPCNTAGVFLAVTVLYLLSPYLKQSWKWFPAAIVVLPICGLMGFTGASLPAVFAVNATDIPNWLTQLCGIASFGLMFLFVHGVSLLVATDSPYRYAPGQRSVTASVKTTAGLGIRTA
jgi:hypothetical protein